MSRVVIEVRDELHERFKEQARKEGRPQVVILREIIEAYLKKKESQ